MLGWLLALCLLLAPASAALAAETGGTVGGLRWTLDTYGTLTISGSGAIPDYSRLREGSPDVSDRPWLWYRNDIRTLVVSSGVTRVGARAFQSFDSLERVVLADSVESIGSWAFQNCYALEDVTMAEGVTL